MILLPSPTASTAADTASIRPVDLPLSRQGFSCASRLQTASESAERIM
jgi:hypothetical protein